MFEDSTFESGGRIRTKSKYWMLATAILNVSVVVILILIPLIYPEALPKQALACLSRWYAGDRRNGRALVSSRLGHGTA